MLFTPEQLNELLPEIDQRHDTNGFPARSAKPLAKALRRAQSLDPVNRVSYLESRCYMLNTLLRDSDVMSMAHGLEVRVPLIDHQLAQGRAWLCRDRGSWMRNAKTFAGQSAQGGQLAGQIVHRRSEVSPCRSSIGCEMRCVR
jgi:asparagine synthetase B (glutamine-hydrolysing)